MAKITYPDKSTGDIATAAEATEIKNVVNTNDDLTAAKIPKNVGATHTVNAIVALTQAEYDAIGTPVATTLYFII